MKPDKDDLVFLFLACLTWAHGFLVATAVWHS